MLRNIAAWLLSGIWLSGSEFVRNQVLYLRLWIDKYSTLGLRFPVAPINGAMWGLWSFILAFCLLYLVRLVGPLRTFVIGWIMAYVLMWIAIGNLGVLPFSILPGALPLSLLEAGGAVLIDWVFVRGKAKAA